MKQYQAAMKRKMAVMGNLDLTLVMASPIATAAE